MIARVRHLPEQRLVDCYLAERAGEALDPLAADHLADCQPCGVRYAELTRFMEELRAEGESEADAVFTPDRLRAQQQQIARGLEHVGRAARVITFPARFVRRHIATSTSHAARPWIAAAAAAGLFAGVGVGIFFDAQSRTVGTRRPTAIVRQATHLTPAVPFIDSATDEDAFMSELEIALDRPHTRELQALDALTPHVREVSSPR